MLGAPRKLAAALILAALAVPAAAQAATPPLVGVNLPGFGDSSSPAQAEKMIAYAHKLHATIVRVDFPWSAFEPNGPTLDPSTLALTDRLVAAAGADGIKIVATVASTPCWASSAPASLRAKCKPANPNGASSWPPSNDSDYASVLAEIAKRYGSDLAAIEVWNEPDQANEDYFAGPQKATRYAALLRAAYPAVKQVAPSLPVLAGSLVGSNGNFLRALYAAGIKGYYDGLSVHYYGLTLGAVRAIHEVQLANGDTTKVWLDEFGWPSCWPKRKIEEEQGCVTTAAQAQNLRNTVRELARAPYIAATIVYKLQDSRGEEFGMLAGGGKHKASFAALSEAFAHPFGSFSKVTLGLRTRGGRVVASGSGPNGDYMELEASVGGRLRYRALFTLNRFNTYSIALPSVLGTSGLTVKVFQYWTGAGRSAQKSI